MLNPTVRAKLIRQGFKLTTTTINGEVVTSFSKIIIVQ